LGCSREKGGGGRGGRRKKRSYILILLGKKSIYTIFPTGKYGGGRGAVQPFFNDKRRRRKSYLFLY